MSDLTWVSSSNGVAYYAYVPLPNGVTATNYLFSVIMYYQRSGGYCNYIGYVGGQLMICAREQPSSTDNGNICVKVFYNGLI